MILTRFKKYLKKTQQKNYTDNRYTYFKFGNKSIYCENKIDSAELLCCTFVQQRQHMHILRPINTPKTLKKNVYCFFISYLQNHNITKIQTRRKYSIYYSNVVLY